MTPPNGRWIYKQWAGIVLHADRNGGMQIDRMPVEVWQSELMAAVASDSPTSEDSEIVLHAKDAKVVGRELIYWDKVDRIAGWRNARDYADWHVALRPGAYQVIVQYSGPGPAVRSDFAFGSPGAAQNSNPITACTFTLHPTPTWDELCTLAVGTITIPRGLDAVLRLWVVKRSPHDPGAPIADIKTITLRRR